MSKALRASTKAAIEDPPDSPPPIEREDPPPAELTPAPTEIPPPPPTATPPPPIEMLIVNILSSTNLKNLHATINCHGELVEP